MGFHEASKPSSGPSTLLTSSSNLLPLPWLAEMIGSPRNAALEPNASSPRVSTPDELNPKRRSSRGGVRGRFASPWLYRLAGSESTDPLQALRLEPIRTESQKTHEVRPEVTEPSLVPPKTRPAICCGFFATTITTGTGMAVYCWWPTYTIPLQKRRLRLHLARSKGPERYFGCNLMHRKVLASSCQHLMAEALDRRTSPSRGGVHTWGTPFFCFTQRDLDRC